MVKVSYHLWRDTVDERWMRTFADPLTWNLWWQRPGFIADAFHQILILLNQSFPVCLLSFLSTRPIIFLFLFQHVKDINSRFQSIDSLLGVVNKTQSLISRHFSSYFCLALSFGVCLLRCLFALVSLCFGVSLLRCLFVLVSLCSGVSLLCCLFASVFLCFVISLL